jgi:crossover junction endodeoxyribonuclease RuvC
MSGWRKRQIKESQMFVIGIDPGARGAVAILESGGKLTHVFDMPAVEIMSGGKLKRRVSPEMLASELRLYADQGAVAVVEQVGAMPGQGVTSMFAFGESFGLVKGVLAGLGVVTSTVTPGKWKKALGVNAGKDGSRAKAAQLWPSQAHEFKRVKDDGKAEASLLAEYWRVCA